MGEGVRISAISFLNALNFGKTGGRRGGGRGFLQTCNALYSLHIVRLFNTSLTVHQAIDRCSVLILTSTSHGQYVNNAINLPS